MPKIMISQKTHSTVLTRLTYVEGLSKIEGNPLGLLDQKLFHRLKVQIKTIVTAVKRGQWAHAHSIVQAMHLDINQCLKGCPGKVPASHDAVMLLTGLTRLAKEWINASQNTAQATRSAA